MLDFVLKPLTRALVPRYRPSRPPSKLVAIVVPASTQESLSSDEEVSLRHLRRFLQPYDKYVIVPRGSRLRLDGLQPVEISRKFFGSVDAHNRLLHSPFFYRLFDDYQYILIFHLDALVFRDELVQWCETGVDFVGAPWIPCPDYPWVKEPYVGNGGFALMKVDSCLRVVHNRYRMAPGNYWHDRFARAPALLHRALEVARQITPTCLRGPHTARLRRELRRLERIKTRIRNNDQFWARDAVRFLPAFRIPDWRTGLRFAFEGAPRHCFALNENRLPFGCHAWTKYDRGFWENHLLRTEVASRPAIASAPPPTFPPPALQQIT